MPYRAIEDSEVVETQVDGYKDPKITSTVDKESEKFIITVRNSIVSNSSSGGNGGKPTGGSTGTETGAPWPTSTAKPNQMYRQLLNRRFLNLIRRTITLIL